MDDNAHGNHGPSNKSPLLLTKMNAGCNKVRCEYAMDDAGSLHLKIDLDMGAGNARAHVEKGEIIEIVLAHRWDCEHLANAFSDLGKELLSLSDKQREKLKGGQLNA